MRAQDVGMRTADDPVVLEWAAEHGRILLTHDVSTMVDFAYTRVVAGLPMPGVFAVRESLPTSMAIEELLMIDGASGPGDWKDAVYYLPLR